MALEVQEATCVKYLMKDTNNSSCASMLSLPKTTALITILRVYQEPLIPPPGRWAVQVKNLRKVLAVQSIKAASEP